MHSDHQSLRRYIIRKYSSNSLDCDFVSLTTSYEAQKFLSFEVQHNFSSVCLICCIFSNPIHESFLKCFLLTVFVV